MSDAGTAGTRPADTADAAVIAHTHMASRAAAMPYPPPQKRGHDQVTRWAEDVLLRSGSGHRPPGRVARIGFRAGEGTGLARAAAIGGPVREAR
ncbi:hypothetical protein [Streptomyces sp. NPDC002559]